VKEDLGSADEFYSLLHALTGKVQETINKIILRTKPSPFTKHWWSQELVQCHANIRRLAHLAYKRQADPHDPIHHEYKTLQNSYSVMIENAKKAHWVDFLKNLNECTVWTAHKFALSKPSDGGRAWVPMLKVKASDGSVGEAVSCDDKSTAFEGKIFLEPDHAAPSFEGFAYPILYFTYSPITDQQILWVISWLGPYKAPSTDGIPNVFFIR